MQNKYPSARYQYLKHKVSIIEVLEHVTGKPLGFDRMIRCPLHDDKTPSMKINIEWNGCKCFGTCGRWFDPIALWAEFQNIKPHQALEDLEKLFDVKWDGSPEEFEETEDQMSPWPRLEAELVRLCGIWYLTEAQRIQIRESYWLAQADGHDVNLICKLIGFERATQIIEKWRSDNGD